MMKHVPDQFKKLTIIIPPPSDALVITSCPGIGPRAIPKEAWTSVVVKPGKRRS